MSEHLRFDTNSPTGMKACGRCRGTGHHSSYGGDTRCFSCMGSGVVTTFRRRSDEEIAALVEEAGNRPLDPAEERAVERIARRASRMPVEEAQAYIAGRTERRAVITAVRVRVAVI